MSNNENPQPAKRSSKRLERLVRVGLPLCLGMALLGVALAIFVESRQIAVQGSGAEPSPFYGFMMDRILLPSYETIYGGGTNPAPAQFAQFISYVLMAAAGASFLLLTFSFMAASSRRTSPGP